MRKQLLMLGIGLLSAVSTQAQTSPWTGSAVGAGDFYLYNVESGKWLQNNDVDKNFWTTYTGVGARGFDVELIANGDGYQLNPKFGHNKSINSSEDFGYLDTGRPVSVWTFTPVEGVSNGYSITSGSTILSTVEDANLGYLISTNTAENSTWQLVTKADRLAAMSSATLDNPIDATWLIGSPNFANNDERIDKWTRSFSGGNNVRNGDGVVHANCVFESWNSTSINMYQTITGIPNGIYKMSVQGYYRDGSFDANGNVIGTKHKNGTEKIRSYYFANTVSHPFMSICDEGQTEKIDGMFADASDGIYIPNNLNNASNCFFNGYYKNEEITAYVADGTLTIGVRKNSNEGVSDDWTVFDNFTLTYCGAEIDVTAAKAQLQTALDAANAYTGFKLNTLVAAIADGQAKLSSDNANDMVAAATLISNILSASSETITTTFANTIKLCKAENNGDSKFAELIDADQAFLDAASTTTDFSTKLNALRIARKVFLADKQDDVFAGNAPEEGDFYLYNVGQKRFLCGGGDWGAHAAVGFPGVPVTLVADGAGFVIDTHLNNGGTSEYLNNGGYCDTPTKDVWNFVQVSDGIYNIARASDANLLLGYQDDSYCDVNTDKNGSDNVNNQWKLVTKADRDALLDAATLENPVDATYLITAPGFNQRENVSLWINENGVGGIFERGKNHPDFVYECYNSASFMITQTINSLKNGFYKVGVQGFYRDGSRTDHAQKIIDGTELAENAILFANSEEVNLPLISSDMDKAPGYGWVSAVGEYPDGCLQSADYFENGLYKTSLMVDVKDGSLLIGIGKEAENANDWVNVDNFRLTYYGASHPTGINDVKDNTVTADGKIYNFQGIQVKDASQRGFYIKNGKKFSVK